MLRERRLRPIRQVIELIGSSGFSIGQIFESIKAISGFLNGLGIDKTKLVELLGLLDLVKQFQAVEGPWTDEEALGERVRIALAMARLAAAVTGTTRDDELVELIDKYATDERVIALLAMVLGKVFARHDAGGVGTLELDEVELHAAEFKRQGFDPTLLITLLPYLLELLKFLRERRQGKADVELHESGLGQDVAAPKKKSKKPSV